MSKRTHKTSNGKCVRYEIEKWLRPGVRRTIRYNRFVTSSEQRFLLVAPTIRLEQVGASPSRQTAEEGFEHGD